MHIVDHDMLLVSLTNTCHEAKTLHVQQANTHSMLMEAAMV